MKDELIQALIVLGACAATAILILYCVARI